MKINIELTGILEQAITAIASREGADPTEYFTARCYDLAARYARQEGIKAIDEAKKADTVALEASIDAALPAKAEVVAEKVVREI